jgi:dipeptidyl aminopeptidase/acylaminoacyl peptidase
MRTPGKNWDATSGEEARAFKGHSRTVRSVAFSPDGARLVSASEDQSVRLWDVESGEELRTLLGHSGQVVSVAFSSDGARIASASEDRTVKLWDAETGQELRSFHGHTGSVLSVDFSPDGTRLASTGRDRTVKLWEIALGRELRTLRGHTGPVWSAAFSPDGSRLATASEDRTLLWDGRPLTSDVKAEVEAVAYLGRLFRKPLPKSEVRAAIQRDKLISEAVREKALELADRYPEETDPKKYHAAAWPVIRHPYANEFQCQCQFALAQIKAACERAPDQEQYRIALGVAQYRLGKFQNERYVEALETLTGCDPNDPATLAFLAMARRQLGQQEEARTAFAELQEVMQDERWTTDPDAQFFLRKAAELMEGPAQPKPRAVPNPIAQLDAAHRGGYTILLILSVNEPSA